MTTKHADDLDLDLDLFGPAWIGSAIKSLLAAIGVIAAGIVWLLHSIGFFAWLAEQSPGNPLLRLLS